MKLTALADLPNGVKAGEVFEVPDYQGRLLLKAKVVTCDDPTVMVDETVTGPPALTTRRPRYQRRDMTAEGETE